MAETWHDGDIIRCTARLRSASGEDIENVFHWKLYLNQDMSDGQGFYYLKPAVDMMYDAIQPEIPSDVTFVDMDFANLTQDLVYGASAWPTQTVGGGTGDTMPEQNCALVVGRTNAPHAIGRKFLGPFIEAANADGAWGSTLLGMLGTFAGLYDNAVTMAEYGAGIPGIPKIVNDAIVAFNHFYEVYTSNQVYTQRRRRRGVGA